MEKTKTHSKILIYITKIFQFLGNYEFSKYQNYEEVKDFKKIAEIFLELPIEYIPESNLIELENFSNEVSQDLAKSIYKPQTTTGLEEISKIMEFYTPFLLLIKNEVLPVVVSFEKKKEELNQKINDTERLIKDYAAKAAVGEHKNYFQRQTEILSGRATKWLTATIWLGSATLIIAIILAVIPFLTSVIPLLKMDINLFQYITSKILLIGILLTATIWCGRNYKSLMHQLTVNSQKAVALDTFRTFIESAENNAIKDAIILETTKSIFSIPNTGYLEGEPSSDGSLKVFELIKNFSSNK